MAISHRVLIVAVITSILMSLSQIFWKLGAISTGHGFVSVVTNIPLITGFVLYGFCAVLMVFSLRSGQLSTVYPVFALSFVFVNILAWLIFYESMNTSRWLGVFAVVLGITMIGLSKEQVRTDA